MCVSAEGAERERLQKMLESLNKAAFRIQKSKTQEEIFTATAEELKQFAFHVVFMVFNHEKTAGRIVHVTAGKPLKNLESLEDIPISELEFPFGSVFRKNIIKKKEFFYIKEVKKVIRKAFSKDMREISEKIVDIMGIARYSAIFSPLIVNDECMGVLGVISESITEKDVPVIRAFANQVSTALENVTLSEESQRRTTELTKNLKEQQMFSELNTQLFLAQTEDEVLDAAIEGIHALGRSFSNISLINKERTYTTIVRFKMEPNLLRIMEKIGRKAIPEWTILGYKVPVWEKDNIYHTFFETGIPLITSNIEVEEYPVKKADLSEIYAGFATKERIFQATIQAIAKLLPYKSVMVFPIRAEGVTIGTLAVTSKDVFTQEDFHVMRTVAEMVSGAMERVIQSEKLKETFNELRAVQKINMLLNTGASLQQILDQISYTIKEIYHYQFAYPLLLDPSRRYLTFTYVSVPPEVEKDISEALDVDLRDFKYSITENFSLLQVIKEKKCLIRNVEELTNAVPANEGNAMKNTFSSLSKGLKLNSGENNIMIAPLPYGEEVIGVLLLGHKKPLIEKDFQRLEYFLDQVGIAIAKSDTESKLRQSLKELKELDQMKSEFIDIASHELRTPLTTLKLYLEMMALEQYGKLSEPVKERIQVMEEGVSRLEEIINQTLVASRLIKNKLELRRTPVSLLEIASEVVQHLRPLWKAKDQHVFIESPRDLSDVKGDKRALFIVLSSLMDNAIRYSSNNTEILIKLEEHPGEIECMVCDQGCGIPSEHVDKVFDEFYIVPSETEYARIDGRTGLGLFIVKGIVERHNGKIWVESTPEKGSTFHFVLPVETPA